MADIIQIEQLCKTFGSGETAVAALNNVSLQVQSGEIFGIIGLSGAGKSTLVRCINVLERPEAGRILFHGQNLLELKEKFGPSHGWAPHTTMIIDEPETMYKALPIVMQNFKSFSGKVTSLHLYEFFPTRHILTVDFCE